MIKRVQMASGRAWASQNQWFWLSFGGEIYSFSLQVGRFSFTIDSKSS